MNQKPSVVQIIKSVPQVLTSDRGEHSKQSPLQRQMPKELCTARSDVGLIFADIQNYGFWNMACLSFNLSIFTRNSPASLVIGSCREHDFLE
ncbi:hypothetical protein WNY61_19770 [Sulfitobacter sp. AS92]|uniref:hypothetical protein n=1 Tax=Sulfitobacter sp. AS92 TaxID=3135783 RepID=UPI00317B4483